MPIAVRAIEGDLFEIGPQFADAVLVWVRSGFNGYHHLWLRMTQEWPLDPQLENYSWDDHNDHLYELRPPVGRMSYVYELANPGDLLGYPSLNDVETAFARGLVNLDRQRVSSVATIHIPTSVDGQRPNRIEKLASATQMIQTVQLCEEQLEHITEVLFVDLRGDFQQLV